ncbi:biliverdin-producing heme oxygenase [Rhodocytophaga rosea]|uniref:Biliverdin-producing heme oxygenase n=1 Tax=Rhodocytophaga rosea TaxID=2704465 RepID=A0A6C0GQF3_9BACT|nr:biliverdin-producing heme oxygenase [Rhodocytophaga rosea]QHT70305.1 biliverdin-producing heme oxygenase [Rhodocytophaga rosea]
MITQELRNKTEENHLRLEQSPILLPLSEGSLTRDNYIVILQHFYGFFQPLESALQAFAIHTHLPDFASRRKASLLSIDLKALLGSDYTTPTLSNSLPDIENISQAMGCLYVMEGSTLGGKMIYNRVQQHLGLDYTNGASFFYGYGSETGQKWKSFQQALISFSSTFHTDQDIITAANDTFTTFKKWLDTGQ